MFLYWTVYQKGYNGSIRQLITTKKRDYFYKTDFYEFNFYEIVITDNHIVDKHILCEDEEGRIIRKMIEEYSWNIIYKIGEKSCLISIGNLDVQFNVLSFMIYSLLWNQNIYSIKWMYSKSFGGMDDNECLQRYLSISQKP